MFSWISGTPRRPRNFRVFGFPRCHDVLAFLGTFRFFGLSCFSCFSCISGGLRYPWNFVFFPISWFCAISGYPRFFRISHVSWFQGSLMVSVWFSRISGYQFFFECPISFGRHEFPGVSVATKLWNVSFFQLSWTFSSFRTSLVPPQYWYVQFFPNIVFSRDSQVPTIFSNVPFFRVSSFFRMTLGGAEDLSERERRRKESVRQAVIQLSVY